jgi:hypothetical protein
MRALGLAAATALLVVMALCCSCSERSDHSIYLRDRVSSIRGLTLPSGSVVTKDSGLLLSGYSAAANWEFETREERKDYLSWVREQLESSNFRLQTSDESSLLLIKTSGEEADTIKIQVTPSNQGLRVQVAFAIDSD